MPELVAVSRRVALKVWGSTVFIELICGDDYEAQVAYDDIRDRLEAGEGLTLALHQDGAARPAKEDGR